MKLILALKLIFVAGAIAGTLAGAPAWADRPQAYNYLRFQSGNSLLALCTSAKAAAMAECFRYLEAVAEAVTDTTNHRYFGIQGTKVVPIEPLPLPPGSLVPILACVPAGVTDNQLRDITVQFLQATPGMRQDGAFQLVEYALHGAFPCPK